MVQSCDVFRWLIEEASFYKDMADGPLSTVAYLVRTYDGVRLRVDAYQAEVTSTDTIILLLDRFG